MKRGLVLASVFIVLILSLGFVSAGWFSDVWGKITGNAILEQGLVSSFAPVEIN